MEYTNIIPVIEVNQKIGTFFLSKLTPKILHTIANKKLSRYEMGSSGIQRNLNQEKISQIQKYITEDKTAAFPNTIIIAIQNDDVINEKNYVLSEEGIKILLKEGVANILDGQHRLYGLSIDEENFELPVAIFLDLSIGEQAKIFAKINSTQTKVSLDLVYELFDLSNERHTEKSAYYIVRHLSENVESPWCGLVKNLSDRKGLLAQGSMAKFIDKELLSDGKVLNSLYIAEKEDVIFVMLKNYYDAVKETFPESWGNSETILNKSTGFIGTMRFFIDISKICKNNKTEMSKELFLSYLNKIKLRLSDLSSDKYRSGAVGQNEIRDVLRGSLSTEEKSFLKIR